MLSWLDHKLKAQGQQISKVNDRGNENMSLKNGAVVFRLFGVMKMCQMC